MRGVVLSVGWGFLEKGAGMGPWTEDRGKMGLMRYGWTDGSDGLSALELCGRCIESSRLGTRADDIARLA